MVRQSYSGLLLGLLLVANSPAFAPAPVYREPPKPKVPELYARMQGVWEVQHANNVVLIRRGVAVKIAPQRIRIEGDCWEFMASDNGPVASLSAKNRIVLDPKVSPTTLDLVQLGFRVEYTTMKGILEVEGDTLRFCYVYAQEKGAERPKQFAVGNPLQPIQPTDPRMMILKRVK